MGAVVIKIDAKNNRLIASLVKELGGKVISIDDEQYEDLVLGKLMEKEKTNELVSRDSIMKKLSGGSSI
jgi:ribosomal protein L19E